MSLRLFTACYRYRGRECYTAVHAHCKSCARTEFHRRWPDVTLLRVTERRAKCQRK